MPYQGPVHEFRTDDGRVAGRVGPTYLTGEETARALLRKGFPRSEGPTWLAVFTEESLLSPDAEGDLLRRNEEWNASLNIAQIRSRNDERGTGTGRDPEALRGMKGLDHALDVAKAIHAEDGWRPWGAYTSGRYRKHMARAEETFAQLEGAHVTTPQDILREAAKEIGYRESPSGSNRNKFAPTVGHANGQPWCRSFTAAIAKRCGLVLPNTSAYTPTAADGYRALKRFDRTPRVGDEVFYDFPDSKNRIQHVGYLETFGTASWGPWVQTIDGNTSDGNGSEDNGGGVYRRVRPMSHVVGFGHPVYEEEDILAKLTEDEQRELLAKTRLIYKACWDEKGGKLINVIDQIKEDVAELKAKP